MLNRVRNWERNLRQSFNVEPTTPGGLRRAQIYSLWFDHAVLRGRWHNMRQIVPGVWASNQPTERRLVRLKASGFRSILTLRGAGPSAHHWLEAEACARLSLSLKSVALTAREAPAREELLRFIALLRAAERPVLFHCKSGADRAGFAAAVCLLVYDHPIAEARRMLSWRYGHLRYGATGVLDYILERYAVTQNGRAFEEWVRTIYDPEAIQAAYDRRR